jgi:glycosyltransferase involved in cell wall biosynthesis
MVERWGGRYFVIGDVPTELHASQVEGLARPCVTVVNTFSYDEPIREVVEAARLLPDVRFLVTGDLRHCPHDLAETAPTNLKFTGYTPMQEYVDNLYSSDLAVVLTTENYTMQRGAYESVSLGVPVVTSDWPILRETFSGGAVFCDNSATGIAEAIRTVLEKKREFKEGVKDLKHRRLQHWSEIQESFRAQYLQAD